MKRSDLILAYAKADTPEKRQELLRILYNKVMDVHHVLNEIDQSSFHGVAKIVRDALEA